MLSIFTDISEFPIATIMTLVMVVLIFISMLAGFIRGLRKSIVYTLFYVLLMVLFFLNIHNLANFVLNLNLESFNILIDGYKVTSLNELLIHLIGVNIPNMDSSLLVSGTSAYALVESLALLVVQQALVILFVVFFEIIYKFIVWLLWLIFFRPFLKLKKKVKVSKEEKSEESKPKKSYVRKKPLRLAGALVGIIPGFMSVMLLFSPLSGIFNVASTLTDSKEGLSLEGYLTKEDYESLAKITHSYDESFVSKIFSITSGKDGKSIELELFEKTTTVSYGDYKVNFADDLDNIAAFVNGLVEADAPSVLENSSTVNVNKLRDLVKNGNDENLIKAFEHLGDAELLDIIFNSAVEYLDASAFLEDQFKLDSDSINYENISNLKWSGEFVNIGKIAVSALKLLDYVDLSSGKVDTILDSIDTDRLEAKHLEDFVNLVFESKVLSEAATLGMSYALTIDDVKKIAGEVNLANVDIKGDLVKVCNAAYDVFVIGTSSFSKVDLKSLASRADLLKNIVDNLLDLSLFKETETSVINYVVDNFIENNNDIKKYIDGEYIRSLKLKDLKVELGSTIEAFGRLGSETKLFDLDSDDKVVNYDALDSKVLRIVKDLVAKSNTVENLMDTALKGVLVPNVLKEEDYDSHINSLDFAWSKELNTLCNVLENVEGRVTNFNIYKMVSSQTVELKLGIIKGLAAYDEERACYYIDDSKFIRSIFDNIIENALKGNTLLEGAFDGVESLGSELDVFVKVLTEAKIVENDDNKVIDPASLERDLNGINMLMIDTFVNYIDQSNLLMNVIGNQLNKITINNKYICDTKSWDKEDYKREFTALANILRASNKIDDEIKTPFDEIGSLFEKAIPVTMLEALADNVDTSSLLKNVMAITLKEAITDVDFDSWNDPANNPNNDKWGNEIRALYLMIDESGIANSNNEIEIDGIDKKFEAIDVTMIKAIEDHIDDSSIIQSVFKKALKDANIDVKDDLAWSSEVSVIRLIIASETYVDASGVYSKIKLSEFSSLDKIRPETIEVIALNINSSTILKDLLKDPITSILKEESSEVKSVDSWDDATWKSELLSLSKVTYHLASKDASKELEGYPEDRIYININNININDGFKLELLNSLLGDKIISNNSLIHLAMNNNTQYGIHHSMVLRKVLREALDGNLFSSSDKYQLDFDSLTNIDYYYEVQSLYNIINDGNLYSLVDGEKYIVINELKDKLNKISKSLVSVATSNIHNSKILQTTIKNSLDGIVSSDFNYQEEDGSEWSKASWSREMSALNEICQVLDEKDGSIDFDSLNGDSIKLVMIEKVRDEIYVDEDNYSLLLQDVMKNNLAKVNDNINFESWDGVKWKSEVASLYNVSLAQCDNDPNASINLNDFQSKEIKMLTLASIRDNIANSELMQEVMKDNLKSINGENFDYSSWNGDKWASEVNALYVVSDTIKVTNALGVEVINLEGELVNKNHIKIASLLAIESVAPTSDILQNAMKDTIDELLNDDINNKVMSCKPLYNSDGELIYVGFDKKQWEVELHALVSISNQIKKVDANGEEYLNTSTIDDEMKNIKISLFDVINDVIYNEEYNRGSYVLQKKLKEPIENIMNTGFDKKLNADRIRYVSDKVGTYSNTNLDFDSEIGLWWEKELNAITLILKSKYGADEVINTSNMDFSSVKISTLNIIRDNIDDSYVMQSLMRKTLEDVMNRKDNENEISLTIHYSTEEWSGEKYYSEMSTLRDVSKTLATLTPDAPLAAVNRRNATSFDMILDETNDNYYVINIDDVDFTNSTIKLATLYFIKEHVDSSSLAESAIRIPFAKMLKVSDDSYLNTWKSESHPLDSNKTRLSYETEAVYDLSETLADSNGNIAFNNSLLTKIHISTFETMLANHDALTGLVTNETSNIKHSYVADFNGISYHSELVRSLLKTALADDTLDINSWSEEEWEQEVYSISLLADSIKDNEGFIAFATISFSSEIKFATLESLEKSLNFSTYIQRRVDEALFTDAERLALTSPAVSYSNVRNQWNDEMFAINSICHTFVEDDATSFRFADINFNEYMRLDTIVQIKDNIHLSTYMQNRVKEAIFVANEEAFPKVGYSLTVNQWNEELESVYNIINNTSFVETLNGKEVFYYSHVNMNNDIDVQVLKNIVSNIKTSTYIQSTLKSTLEGLVDSSLFSRADVVNHYGSSFTLPLGFNDENANRYYVELASLIYTLVDDRLNLVKTDTNGIEVVNLNEITSQLANFSTTILEVSSIVMETYQDANYGISKILTLNYLSPLETLAGEEGITFDPNFKFIGSNNDLVMLTVFLRDGLNVETFNDAQVKIDRINNASAVELMGIVASEINGEKIKEAKAKSFYVDTLLSNRLGAIAGLI